MSPAHESQDLNRSLDDVEALLRQEIERLKEQLEYYRLSDHPMRKTRIRQFVQLIDERQDVLDSLGE